MKTLEQKNAAYYDAMGEKYISPNDTSYLGRYHRKRMDSARGLIAEIAPSGRLYDFGCGSGELFGELAGYDLAGCDISPELVRLCKERFGVDAKIGGVGLFEDTPGPFDVVVALNVLPYLSDDDETHFLEVCASKIPAGGGLLISHTNMLFDLVSLNRYTAEFYRDVLIPAIGAPASAADDVAALLSDREFPPRAGAVGPLSQKSDREAIDKRRADPFTYPAKVESFGFKLERLRPLNAYPIPSRLTHASPALEADQPDWVDRLPPTLAILLSTQFQASFRRV